ncbi:unnamed protein product [Clonostachys rhizophaga]|uniref:Amidase domain-containing protein n=1 Tax=Clonostachys rhizophaga TaxID=160324 RepID=A0A9N9YNW0_9HYPO|nr:unnamed protein product [Clonostachys rhizophaga]
MRLSLLVFLPVCAASITSTGSTIVLNNVPYYISPHSVGSIALEIHALDSIDCVFGFAPVSVLPPGTQPDDISRVFTSWNATDDVFQPGFSQLMLNETQSLNNSTTQKVEVTGQGTSTVASYMAESRVSEGPYFLDKTTGNLHQAYRLYDDFAGAFTEALLDNNDGTFQVLSAKVAGSATSSIGVPSRLYYKPSKEKPLAGVRIAVKDIFSLAGVKRSNGNRAWLIEAGAVIVGTQKLSQFATSEVATVDWVDYHSPFNPRGDGYQDPSESSSGAGASVASYDWLDVAVGTDTGGSIRSPAGVSGVFGNRASHGLVSLDHVMPLSEPLDTVGFLVRDPALWEKLQTVMYGSNYTSLASLQPKYPVNIMTVAYPDSSTEAGRLLNNFAVTLAKFLGGNVSTLDVASAWTRSKTDPFANLNFTESFNITYPVLTGKGQNNLTNQFFADYASLHDGRRPFVNPSPLARWAWAANYSWDEALHNKTMFADWFMVKFCLQPATPFNAPLPSSYIPARQAHSLRETGEVSKFSNLTNHDEKLPVAVGILAAKGCDGLLARLAMDLVDEGILKIPQVGSSISGGPILF